jgi:hypothetical protein
LTNSLGKRKQKDKKQNIQCLYFFNFTEQTKLINNEKEKLGTLPNEKKKKQKDNQSHPK